MPGKELSVSLPEKFRSAATTKCRYVVFFGGRGGAKTYSYAIIFLLKALQSKVKILCVREIMDSIQNSVFETIKLAMDIMGVKNLFDITHNIITCKVTGSTFIFAGLYRNIEKIKSIPGINYVWVNEADKVSEESLQLLLPTVREEGSQCYFEFNPGYEDDPVYKRFVAQSTPDSLVVEVSWRDNPFISQTLLKEKDTDYAMRPEEAAHVWGGKLKRAGAQIWMPPFEKDTHIKEFDLKTIKDYKVFQALDPHTSFYSASIWAIRWKSMDRFITWIYDEYPKYSDVNADYSDIRKKLHYTGTVSDLARTFFAKETGLQITQRYIDTRYAKGFGSQQSNLINNTEGLVESFAKPVNGGILYLMPMEVHIDEARDKIKSDMRWNQLAEKSPLNEPCFFVSEKCKNVIRSLTNHRYEEDNERESEVYKDHSDCFTKGTPIWTSKGWKDINKIKIGDKVLTRLGYKRVINSFCTGYKTVYRASFSNGAILILTASHNFYTNNIKKPLVELTGSDALSILCTPKTKESLWHRLANLSMFGLTGSSIIVTRSLKASLIVCITIEDVLSRYTEMFGCFIKDIYQKVCPYIIKMKILRTTLLRTLRWCPAGSTNPAIWQNQDRENPQGTSNYLKKYDLLQASGIPAPQEELGTKNIGKNVVRACLLRLIKFVKIVEKVISDKNVQNSVTLNVKPFGEITTKKVVISRIKKLKKKQKTYNITVEDQHEYYANGILVANCIRILYAGLSEYRWPSKPKPRPDQGYAGEGGWLGN